MFSDIECTYSTYPLHRVPTQLTSCDLWNNLLCWALSHVCMSVIHVYIYYISTCSMNVIVFLSVKVCLFIVHFVSTTHLLGCANSYTD